MSAFLLLILFAAPDGGVPRKPHKAVAAHPIEVANQFPVAGIWTTQLRVFRAREELPRRLAKAIPADFDWNRFEVAVDPAELGTDSAFQLITPKVTHEKRGLAVAYP